MTAWMETARHRRADRRALLAIQNATWQNYTPGVCLVLALNQGDVTQESTPRKRTCAVQLVMSAKCQERTLADGCRQHRLFRDERLLLWSGCKRLRLFTFGLQRPGVDRTSSATETKGPGVSRASFLRRRIDGLVVHPAHAAARHCRSCGLLLRHFGDHGFRGDQQAGDRNCAL